LKNIAKYSKTMKKSIKKRLLLEVIKLLEYAKRQGKIK